MLVDYPNSVGVILFCSLRYHFSYPSVVVVVGEVVVITDIASSVINIME